MKRAKNPAEGHFKELTELRQRVTALEAQIKELSGEADILRALKNAVETTQLGVTITDTEGMIIYTNAAEAHMHGYSVEELIGKSVRIFAPREQWQSMKSKQLKEIKRWKRECENIRKDGSTFPVQLLSNFFVDAAGNPLGIISTSEDITERKLAEKGLQRSREDLERQVQNRTAELLKMVKVLEHQMNERKAAEKARWKSEKKLRDVAASLGEGIYVLNEQGNLTFINQEAERLLGWAETELINEKVHNIIHCQKADGTPLSAEECSIHNVLKTGTRFVSEDEVFIRKGGKIFPIFVISSPIIEDGKVTAVVTAFRDTTERKRLEEKVRHQAYYDFLTDLPNRMLFLTHLSHALTHAFRNRKALAVLFLDLDHFKKINDSFGHAVGDELLKYVAGKLKSCIRAEDTVARIGGDEFSILLPEIAHANDAGRVAGKIISHLRKPLIVDGHEFHITTSIGISIYPEDSDYADTLLKNADIAMYHAKEQGRKNYQFYNPAMNINNSERIAMENQLYQTLDRGELSVYYQPIVSAEKRRLFCSEALVRWRHPELGLLSPSRFIPLAEETGFIIPLGEWVLRTACAQNKEWQESGYPPFRMTVNLSAHQFQDSDLVEKTSRILSETGLNPEFLELEITEGTAMRDVEHTIPIITRLIDMGVRFAIDDFGVGYSSLSYLKKLPIQTLKIDKSFIRGITADPGDKAIVNAMIAMAHNLNLKVVAEGVETEGQMAFLQLSRCDGMQGYLVSRPLPADEFRARILA